MPYRLGVRHAFGVHGGPIARFVHAVEDHDVIRWVTNRTEGGAVNRDNNPSNLDDVVGEYARADTRQAETAIDSAHEAF